MKTQFQIVVLFVLLFFISLNANTEIVPEVTVGGGYQGNLFNDSNSISDQYATIGTNIKYYPSASSQFSAVANYNAFTENGDLSNYSGEASVVIIPTPDSLFFTLALSGNLSIRKFGQPYKVYDHVGSTIGANISCRLIQKVHLQSSLYYLNNSYTNSEFGSNHGFDIATGVNFTVLGSNSFTLKIDYSRRSFDQPTLIQQGEGIMQINNQNNSETFDITGIIIRYSRPLGKRTGLNLSIGQRKLHFDNNFTVQGYTIDYLSPWANFWEGTSFFGGLKHFFPGQITAELSFAYYDKDFLDVVEISDVTSETYWPDVRYDQLITLSLIMSKPISLQGNKMITPSFFMGYQKNQSSAQFFDFEDFRASISLKFSI